MRVALALLLLTSLVPLSSAQGNPCDGFASPATVRLGSQGGTRYVDITAPVGCSFVVSSPQAWITVSSAQLTSTGSPATLGINVDANAAPDARSGFVDLASTDGLSAISVSVDQFGGCDVRVARSSFSFPMEGGQGLIEVTMEDSNCASGISFSTASEWIQLDHVGGFSVAPNDGAERQGTITVGIRDTPSPQFVQVYQTGTGSSASDAPTHPTGEGDWMELEAPGFGVALAGLALLVAIALRRR